MILGSMWFWCRFRLLRRYIAYNPLEVPRFYSLLGPVAAVCPGHVPTHLLVESAGVLGFTWDTLNSGWTRPGPPYVASLGWALSTLQSCYLECLDV